MKWKNKSWITIWLILVCAALLVTGTYAAYTNVEYIKRVVSTKDSTQNVYFTSNFLLQREKGSQEYPLRVIPAGREKDVSITVSVCNYLQNDITKINQETISYTLTAQLVDLNNTEIHSDTVISYQNADGTSGTVTGSDLASYIHLNESTFDANGRYSANGALTGMTPSEHYYKITCPKEYISMLNSVAIQIKAVPDSSSQVDIQLMGQLRITTNVQQTTSWEGGFTGLGNDPSASTTGLDAFNYTMSGTIQQKVRLKWNADKVTLGLWSRKLFGTNVTVNSVPDTTYEYIDIDVGGPGQPTNYNLQFYRVNGIPENETVADVKGYVFDLEILTTLENSGT